MDKIITIGKPYIVESDEYVYLYSDISINDLIKPIYYRFNRIYKKYLVYESCDAFLVGLLYFALIEGYDIKCDIPVSEKLYYQLTNILIPTLVDNFTFFNNIDIFCDTVKINFDQKDCAATGISCGIDSFYSILSNINHKYETYNVSYLLFTDIPATVYSDNLKEKWFSENLEKVSKVALDLQKELIVCSTNINKEFIIKHFTSKEGILVINEGLGSLQYCSVPLCIAKMFKVYYLGSIGFSLKNYKIDASPFDSAYMDFLNMPSISTEYLTFYSSGIEKGRNDKLKYIADNEIVQKNLLACSMPVAYNCGKCSKCIRTMSNLYVIDKLDSFKNVYPVEEYKSKYTRNIAYIMAEKNKSYGKEILVELRKNKKHIPILSYPLSIYYSILKKIKLLLRDNQIARHIYYFLKIDEKTYGVSTKEMRSKDFESEE